ncbi:hypothetical protein DRN75_02500 [Nanoarchaeota archaeon]|nr:MAG: hypothetical protein DRN75_02500 [Nanoarchaeota archaeon]
MNQQEREDIISLLENAIPAIKRGNDKRVKQLSDRIIHSAAIFQDKYAIQLATTIYALYKIMKNDWYKKRNKQEYKAFLENVYPMLTEALSYIKKGDTPKYYSTMSKVLKLIGNFDRKFGQYLGEVIRYAMIKKASRVYYHGISLGRVAEMIGVSEWELMDYVGGLREDEFPLHEKVTPEERIKWDLKGSVVMDTSTVIVSAANCMLPLLKEIKSAKWVIPVWVREEAIGRALEITRFAYQAIRIESAIKENTINVMYNESARELSEKLLYLANNTFKARGKWIKIVHKGEVGVIALAKTIGAEYVAIDERTARTLVENPEQIKELLERRLHTNIEINTRNLQAVRDITNGLKVIRSAEIFVQAFKMGLFNRYINGINRAKLIRSVLWALKYKGCAIKRSEIEKYVELLR